MIKSLPKNKYQDYPINFSYQSDVYYDVETNYSDNEMIIKFKLKPFSNPIKKSFVDTLYAPHYENAEAYGYYLDEELAGILEVNFETWNKRLRITECIVFDQYLRNGIGSQLMDFAKERALNLGARALVLETQTSNVRAISFYKSCGFTLIGTDLSAYSNSDVKECEVRIEMGLFL